MEHEGINELVHEQGWNSESLLNLIEDFLNEKGLLGELETFLEEKADEENGEG